MLFYPFHNGVRVRSSLFSVLVLLDAIFGLCYGVFFPGFTTLPRLLFLCDTSSLSVLYEECFLLCVRDVLSTVKIFVFPFPFPGEVRHPCRFVFLSSFFVLQRLRGLLSPDFFETCREGRDPRRVRGDIVEEGAVRSVSQTPILYLREG